MQDAFKAYLLGNGTEPTPAGIGLKPDVPLSCVSGKCQWNSYQSLGICGKCADMASSSLVWTCSVGSQDWTSRSVPSNRNTTVCGWHLNTGNSSSSTLMSGYVWNGTSRTRGETLISRIFPLANPITGVPYPIKIPSAFSDVQYPILNFFFATTLNGKEAMTATNPPIAQECSVYWCVQNLSTSYFVGNFSQEIKSEFHIAQDFGFPWTPAKNESTVAQFLVDIVLTHPDSKETFTVSNVSHTEILAVVQPLTPSFVTLGKNETTPLFNFFSIQSGAGSRTATLDNNPWAGRNISQHIGSMANELTNVLRSIRQSSIQLTGESWQDETIIVVRLEWLTLPLVVLVSSLGFLTATIMKTLEQRQYVAVWGNSATAVLINGLPGSVRDKINALGEDVDVEEKVHALPVQLQSRHNGWNIRNTLSPNMANIWRDQSR